MVSRLPAAFRGRTDAEDVAADVAAVAGSTMAERALILESLCQMAAEQTAQHANPQRVLDWQDPIPPESEALLARLRAQYRDG
jgi:hypothetical protein